jgi:hypothetical protein
MRANLQNWDALLAVFVGGNFGIANGEVPDAIGGILVGDLKGLLIKLRHGFSKNKIHDRCLKLSQKARFPASPKIQRI